MRRGQGLARWPLTGLAGLTRLTATVSLGVLLVLGVPGAGLAQAAPDVFYMTLLRDGKAEMLRGDATSAKKSFRLACFGFLEQPALLAEGLVRLGLAERALNDREAFVATFTRLAEVEERFAAYVPAALSAAERQAFEEKAVEWVTPEVLRSLPSFAPLLSRKTVLDLSKLSARERVRELERLAATEPGNPHWRVLLAQDEAADDRMAKVLSRLEGVPDSADGGLAGCLRGRALAGLDRCAEALAPLDACAGLTTDPLLAAAQLTCLVDQKREDAARELAAKIPRPTSEAPAVRKAISRIPERRDERIATPGDETPTADAPVVVAEKVPAKEEKPATRDPAGKPPTVVPAAAAAAKPDVPASGSPVPGPASTVPPSAGTTAPLPADRPATAPNPQAPGKPAVAPPPVSNPPVSNPPVSGPAVSGPALSNPAPSNPALSNPEPAKPQRTKLTAEEERIVADARTLLKTEENRDVLRSGLAVVRPVADRLPGRADLQLLVGEIAYRAGLWTTGAEYLKRSTPGGKGPVDPTQRFYYAVCLYEAGDFAGAAAVASSGLEKLQRPPFVESYLQKIRAARP